MTIQQIQAAVSPEVWASLKPILDTKDLLIANAHGTLQATIDSLNAEHAQAIAAEASAVHARLDALVQAGQEAHAKRDLVALGAVLDIAYGYTSGARRAKLEADLAAAQAAAAEAATKLAAL